MLMRSLGQNGPQISALGLGCMSFGGIFGPTTEAESLACLDAAWEAGINFFDTANIYGMGLSESILGRWLTSRRPEGLVLATKAGIANGPPRSFDNSAAYLRAELEASLRRLGRERVDLFYIHRRDIRVPLEDLLETLAALIAEGKIGGYGLSEVAPSTLRAAHALLPCLAVQNEYSLWSRQPELGLLQASAALGVTFVAFSPLARGMLGDQRLRLDQVQDGFRAQNPRFVEPAFSANAAMIDGFRALAAARGLSTPALALAWVLARAPHGVAIPGTRQAARLRQWLAASDLALGPQDLAQIEAVLPAGFAIGDRYSDQQIIGVERYC